MLQLLWQKLGAPSIDDALVTYGRLESLELPGLLESIKAHPEVFIGELLSQDGVLPESSVSLVKLLHMVQDDPDFTGQLLDRTQCVVSDLREVPQEIWPRFLDMDRVEPLGRAVWAVFDQVLDPDIPSADASGDETRELLKEKLLSLLSAMLGCWVASSGKRCQHGKLRFRVIFFAKSYLTLLYARCLPI